MPRKPRSQYSGRVFKKYEVKHKVHPLCQPKKDTRPRTNRCLMCDAEFRVRTRKTMWYCPKCEAIRRAKNLGKTRIHKAQTPEDKVVDEGDT